MIGQNLLKNLLAIRNWMHEISISLSFKKNLAQKILEYSNNGDLSLAKCCILIYLDNYFVQTTDAKDLYEKQAYVNTIRQNMEIGMDREEFDLMVQNIINPSKLLNNYHTFLAHQQSFCLSELMAADTKPIPRSTNEQLDQIPRVDENTSEPNMKKIQFKGK
jgi:hypothetical protein